MTKRTFLDTGVLMAAFMAEKTEHEAALKIIQDDSREFVSSDLIKLELLPKAIYQNHVIEIEFYNLFFDNSEVIAVDTKSIRNGAYKLASKYGLAACDALHADTAITSSVDEFITTEKPTKPFFRIPAEVLSTISIYQKKAGQRSNIFRYFILRCKKIFT